MNREVFYADNGNERMEADTIVKKHGRKSKSHTSRDNFLAVNNNHFKTSLM
jgi:hypothetical protein